MSNTQLTFRNPKFSPQAPLERSGSTSTSRGDAQGCGAQQKSAAPTDGGGYKIPISRRGLTWWQGRFYIMKVGDGGTGKTGKTGR